MIRIKKKLTLPEYRERKPVYETLGYKEISVEEKGYHAIVTFEVDETDKHYPAIKHLEKKLYRKGPSFFPVILFVGISFVLLSIFVIFMAVEGEHFNLIANALGFLIPAFVSLALAVVYTYLYISINKRIVEESPYLKANLSSIVDSIKNK
jgi:hypothetical protein